MLLVQHKEHSVVGRWDLQMRKMWRVMRKRANKFHRDLNSCHSGHHSKHGQKICITILNFAKSKPHPIRTAQNPIARKKYSFPKIAIRIQKNGKFYSQPSLSAPLEAAKHLLRADKSKAILSCVFFCKKIYRDP